MDLLHARLLRAEPGKDAVGEIARSWNWTNPTTLRFELREGLTFSNGQAVTAADAAWSICRMLQPGAAYGWLFDNIRHMPGRNGQPMECPGLQVEGPYSLSIEVTEDPTRLLPALETTWAAIVPAQSAPGEYGQVPGAGPYVVERIIAGSRIVLRPRRGGAIEPRAEGVTFQYIQDDASAANMFRAGHLDALEISNPTLYRLLVKADGQLASPGRLITTEPQQIRLLIFNRTGIAHSLGLSEIQAGEWIDAFRASVNVDDIAQRFAPLLAAMHTSYFPARDFAQRSSHGAAAPSASGHLTIITENDPFSDQIAAAIAQPYGNVELNYVGLEKSVMISHLINREYDIISFPIEAIANHSAYWLSFFKPGSAFTLFGVPLSGLDLSQTAAASASNAKLIDDQGNWLVLARERRFVALQPQLNGETFTSTGLIDYAQVGVAP